MSALRKVAMLGVLVSLATCSGLLAGTTWLCTLATGVAADEDGTVGPPDLGGLERPTFFRVDPAKKEVTLLAPESRRGEVTRIETIREEHGLHIFSGIEGGRVWVVTINAKGAVTLSITHDGVVWSGFGHALEEGGDRAGEAKRKP